EDERRDTEDGRGERATKARERERRHVDGFHAEPARAPQYGSEENVERGHRATFVYHGDPCVDSSLLLPSLSFSSRGPLSAWTPDWMLPSRTAASSTAARPTS